MAQPTQPTASSILSIEYRLTHKRSKRIKSDSQRYLIGLNTERNWLPLAAMYNKKVQLDQYRIKRNYYLRRTPAMLENNQL